MTSCHSVLNFGAFLRHSTCPNFDWNIFETTLKPAGMFHHPNSPVISPDKAGTPFFFYHHLRTAPKGQMLRFLNGLEKSKGCPSWSHGAFPCFGTWKVERETWKTKQNQGRSELKSPSHTINMFRQWCWQIGINIGWTFPSKLLWINEHEEKWTTPTCQHEIFATMMHPKEI